MLESGDYSVRGYPLLVKEHPPLERRTPQSRVLVVGGTHGDEYASISVTFKWMGLGIEGLGNFGQGLRGREKENQVVIYKK